MQSSLALAHSERSSLLAVYEGLAPANASRSNFPRIRRRVLELARPHAPGLFLFSLLRRSERSRTQAGEERPEPRPALDERQGAKVGAVEVEQVEGEHDDALRRGGDCRAQETNVGDALVVLHDRFPIDHRRTAGKHLGTLNEARVLGRPVMAVAAVGTHLADIDHQFGAVAVVFDLVNPGVSGRRLGDEGRELRLDEARPALRLNWGRNATRESGARHVYCESQPGQ